ncbi:MAG: response regulator [Gammaproteobacteria bacterium]
MSRYILDIKGKIQIILSDMSNHQQFDKQTFARNIVRLVLFGFFLFLGALLYIYYDNSNNLKEFSELLNASESSSKKMQLFSEFAELARGRTRNTIQILETEDPFEQDELNQQLEGYAARFAEIRETLDRMPFNSEDLKLYKSLFDWVPKILPDQREAVRLMIYEDDIEKARKLIYGSVLPGQQKIIDIISELIKREQSYISRNSQQINASMLRVNNQSTLLFGFILVIFLIFSVVIIQRIYRIQKQVSDAYEALEDTIDERTNDLIVARDAAVMASKSKSEFLSSMSHELRTPLNAIIGFSQLLEMEELTETQSDSVKEIHTAGKHLLDLINEVLDLARIEAGRMSVNLDEVELESVIQEIKAMTAPIAERHGITMSFTENVNLVVMSDRTRLKQVLLNLLSNAIKYNRQNGSVDVFVEQINDHVRISVKDTGKGIAGDQREALFEPFNRLGAEGSEIEGTGIGMMVTRQFVELMNGRIDFESELGVGSVFWIELPLARDDSKEEAAVALDEDLVNQLNKTVSASGSGIAYIEDNPANLKFMKKVFEKEFACDLLTANDGVQGLEMVKQRRPALVLLDINLPGMNGLEIVNNLKNDPQTRQIPIVMVSANAMSESISKAMEAGASGYLTKPIEVKKLKEMLNSLVHC